MEKNGDKNKQNNNQIPKNYKKFSLALRATI